MDTKRKVMHPAWQAAHELLSDPEKWFRTAVDFDERGYTEAQVATAMRLMGFGDDVIVLYDGLQVAGYELPTVWIPVNENDSLDVFPGLLATVKAIVELPTLDDVLDAPAAFAAGFELVDQGTHALDALLGAFVQSATHSALDDLRNGRGG